MLLRNKEETEEMSTGTFKPNGTECVSGPLYAHQVSRVLAIYYFSFPTPKDAFLMAFRPD